MRQLRQSKRRGWGFSLLIAVLLIAAGCLAFPLFFDFEMNGQAPGAETSGKAHQAEGPVLLNIVCAGDVMVHHPQLAAQYDKNTGSYNFDNNFQYVKPYLEQADLALCNVETTFGGGPNSGYPLFSAPDTLANALKNAGFDLAFTSNNHMMDTGFAGMQRTLSVLRGAGLQTAGSHLEGEKPYTIVTVKGVKVGVVAYTYETGSGDSSQKFLNGKVVPVQAAGLINSFNYHRLSDGMASVKRDIDDARKDGAQVIICYYHWGEEYQRSPNEWQREMARQTAELGADAIFASHPHVLQPIEILSVPTAPAGEDSPLADGNQTAAENSSAEKSQAAKGKADSGGEQTGADTRQVPVFYSLGNFLSNQRQETMKNRYTEQGAIAQVQLRVWKDTDRVQLVSTDVIPTWLDKYGPKSKPIYAIVPLDGQMAENPALQASGHLKRAQQALQDVTALLGTEFVKTAAQ